jgi:dihydroorotate dehydrogenase
VNLCVTLLDQFRQHYNGKKHSIKTKGLAKSIIMNLYRQLLFPLLTRSEAETAHQRALTGLRRAQRSQIGRFLLRQIAGQIPYLPVEFAGLTFPNPLGMAAGFDKEAEVALALALLGFGHVEVGTLTPRPQAGNPRPRIFRLKEDEALINRMGFPNQGMNAALTHLAVLVRRPHHFVVGVSLGKQKETPLAEAAADYIAVMQAVYPYADYLAVNISSPNTPDLRQLQGGRYLHQLLADLVEANAACAAQQQLAPRPLLVKIAPDLTLAELDEVLTAVTDQAIAGLIATNTTLARDGLRSPYQHESGGLSGRPLRQRSLELVAAIHDRTAGQLPLIGVGGIASAADVQAMLAAGAKLVQLYTGFVYEGPRLPGRILRSLI